MTVKDLPSIDVLRQLISYNPTTGKLIWKHRSAEWFSNENGRAKNACSIWNSRYAGQQAISAVDPRGYLKGAVLGVNLYAHRGAWALYHGEWPAFIDHINGVRSDNRLDNLRVVTVLENQRNQKLNATNSSGHMGVYVSGAGWTAQIKVERKTKHLGSFATFDEAVAARLMAERRHGFHKNHGRKT